MRTLFVCEGNRHRSPTAERLYAATPNVKVRSAGTSPLARVEITDELLEWADVVFVMDRLLERSIRKRFTAVLEGKRVVCLEIPDDYQLMQPELLALLTERLAPHLGAPHWEP
ncbi:low molecular weight protein tyrosine phosphatase family protein [Frigoriglobus tundricola]|uniref:low molecular weight protein tyrosine phosphatase family protein n=1 Tax=Frigoriglobus tundricola TaxID=2774151 RepID=UPI00148EEE12